MPYVLKTKNFDKVLAAMDRLAGLDWLQGVLSAGILLVKNKVAKYPRASKANRSAGAGSRWYKRGYGPQWMTRDSKIHGYQTSETLGRQWTTWVNTAQRWAKIGNAASYAPYVQGRDDQAWFHKERGWITAEDALEQSIPEVEALIDKAVDKAWGG